MADADGHSDTGGNNPAVGNLQIEQAMEEIHIAEDNVSVSNAQVEFISNNSPTVSNIATLDPSLTTSSQLDNYLTAQVELITVNNPFDALPQRDHKPRRTIRAAANKSDSAQSLALTPRETESELELKRKRDSDNSIDKLTVPPNPATRLKHVSFQFQANNNGPENDDDVPDQLKVVVGQDDPARTYEVITEASKTWKLAMEELRHTARQHSRIQHVNKAIADKNPDLAFFGLAPMETYMKPLMAKLLPKIKEQALDLMTDFRELLMDNFKNSERQGNRYLTNVKSTYEELSNPDYIKAERRLLGIIGHYRVKERNLLAKNREEQDKLRPTSEGEWVDVLQQRRIPTAAQTNRVRQSRKRQRESRSRSESGSRRPQRPVTGNWSGNRGGRGGGRQGGRGQGGRGGEPGSRRGGRGQGSSSSTHRNPKYTYGTEERGGRNDRSAGLDEQTIMAWFRRQNNK